MDSEKDPLKKERPSFEESEEEAQQPPKWKPGDDLPSEIIFDFTKQFDPPQFLFSYKGNGFFPKGDIQLIKGLEGNGKSFLTSLLMASALGATNGDLVCNDTSRGVLLVDTEQHPRNIALEKARICRMCGFKEYEVNVKFHILTLVDVDNPSLCADYMEAAIDKWTPGFVVLDGVADVIEDINDRKECSQMVKRLHIKSKQCDCVLLSVIHVNYGSDKAQGNLGTLLRHKVSDELQCTKKKEGGRIYFQVVQTKARNKDIEDFEFEIDDNTYRIGIPKITSPEDWTVDTPAHRKAHSDLVEQIFKGEQLVKTKIIDEIRYKKFGGSDKTLAKAWFDRCLQWGIIATAHAGKYKFMGYNREDDTEALGPQATEQAVPF